jgi:hypothetical protein
VLGDQVEFVAESGDSRVLDLHGSNITVI